jgi:hypothetical protein
MLKSTPLKARTRTPSATYPALTGSLFSGRYTSKHLLYPQIRPTRRATRAGRPSMQACSDSYLLVPVDVVGVEPSVGVRVGEVLKRERQIRPNPLPGTPYRPRRSAHLYLARTLRVRAPGFRPCSQPRFLPDRLRYRRQNLAPNCQSLTCSSLTSTDSGSSSR